MAKQVKPLTEARIKAEIRKGKKTKLFDGGGLFLLIEKKGSMGWRFKYRYKDKE